MFRKPFVLAFVLFALVSGITLLSHAPAYAASPVDDTLDSAVGAPSLTTQNAHTIVKHQPCPKGGTCVAPATDQEQPARNPLKCPQRKNRCVMP